MNALRQDVRFAIRLFRKSPAFALVATLSIALGVGTNTLIFGLIYAALLRPLPFTDPGRIVAVRMVPAGQDDGKEMLSWFDYQDIRRASRAFAETGACFIGFGLTLTGGAEPERVEVGLVSAGLFPLLGVKPMLGRQLREEEDRPGGPMVVLLGHELWQSRYRGDPNIVGRTIRGNGVPYTVVGVMPPGFRFPENRLAAWAPLGSHVRLEEPRVVRNLDMLGRLRSGVDLDAARAEVAAVAKRLAAEHPDSNAGWGATVLPLRRALVNDSFRHVLFGLMGAVGFVLLIACANVAHLLVARAAERRREISVRAAFGACPARIARQLLTEGALLALAGGLLGVAAAGWGLRLAPAALPPLPYWMCLGLAPTVLLWALATTAAAWLLFGLAPVLHARRPDLHEALKDGARQAGSPGGRRVRAALVVAEVAVSTVLLVGASLLLRSFLELRATDLGIEAEGLLTAWTYLPGDAYQNDAVRARHVNQIVDHIRQIPGIEAVAASNNVPVYGGAPGGVERVEAAGRPMGGGTSASYISVTSGFFRALGAPLLRGRDLTPDEAASLSGATVINEALAQKLWPGGQAIGRRFRFHSPAVPGWLTVVGVARDFRERGARDEIVPTAYLPFAYNHRRPAALLLRTQRPQKELLPEIKRAIRSVDPGFPIFGIATMGDLLTLSLSLDRLFGNGFALFGAIGLLLASVGVYGVLSYAVSQRLREIGVRLALGAPRWNVLRLVVGHGIVLTAAGIVLGLLGAAGAARLLAETLYHVSPTDPASFTGVSVLLIEVAFFASYLPARRATEVDPLTVLRGE